MRGGRGSRPYRRAGFKADFVHIEDDRALFRSIAGWRPVVAVRSEEVASAPVVAVLWWELYYTVL